MNTVPAQPTRPQNEPGHLLSWSLIGLLALLLAVTLAVGVRPGPMKPGLGTVLLGVYVLVWGLCFLASYYYSHKAFFLRGLMWVCEHFSSPSHRKMAFFYFALCAVGGGMAIVIGLGLA